MIKYAHILNAFVCEPWAMEPAKLQVMTAFIAAQVAGHKLSAEEIEARITKTAEQDVARRQGAIAILPLRGVIANRMSLMGDISGGTSVEGFSRAFKSALADDAVKAIVIDVDSPGGAVSGTDELSALIHEARGGDKPIVAQVDATAASAAYWIASAADEMAVTPSGSVGSIGVFGVHDDVSAALQQMGVKKTLISAGKFKTEGNPYEPLGEEAKAHMQSRVDAAYDAFVKAVSRNRGVAQSAVRDGFGKGRMVDASAAVAEGMADKVATLDQTLQRFGASLYPKRTKKKAFAIERERLALDF